MRLHGVGTGHGHGRRWVWVFVRFAAVALAVACISGCGPDDPGPPDDQTGPIRGRVATDDPTRFAGMSLDDAEVTGWLDDNGCVPNGWNWVCPQVFVEFGIDPDQTVRAVTLLAPAPRTAGYQGVLPEGISFSDGPETLAQKLGAPHTGRAAPGSSLRWRYPDGRLLIVNFRQINPLQIGHVQVAAP